MFDTREKKERALGTRLFLKAHRCNSPKCTLVRNPYRPGLHGQARRRALSEYGQQLAEKQKIKISYGLRESQMKKVFSAAAKRTGLTGNVIIELLERRLDNVVFRLGFSLSRSVARQLVGHGHILVNDKRMDVSSYSVKVGDKISIRPQSKNHPEFKNLIEHLKKYEAPVWLRLDKEKLIGEMVAAPENLEMIFDVNMVVDYYSK